MSRYMCEWCTNIFVEKEIVTTAWSSFGELVPNILSLLFFIIDIIILKIWNKLIAIKFH